MNIKKIITSIVISISLFALLYYGCSFLIPTEELKTIFLAKFNLNVCALISAGFGIVYLLSSFRFKTTSESEIPLKKFEFLYNQCDNELQKELDKLSDEDKVRYVESTIPLLSIEQNTDLDNYMFKLIRPQKSKIAQIFSKLLLLSLICFIGYTSYETYNIAKPALDNYNTTTIIEDQILYIEGLPPIQLHSGSKGFKKKLIDQIVLNDIKTQPYYLLNNVKMVHLCDGFEYGKLDKIENGSLAFADSYEKAIYVNISSGVATNNLKETISHELSHIYDFCCPDYELSYSDLPEFQALYSAAPNSITEYGSTNSCEFFAEAGAMYVNTPNKLKSKNIDVYNYFDKLFNNQ